MHKDRELCLACETGIIPRASHSNPEGLRLDGPDEHPYTPDALLSEPNCPSSNCTRGYRNVVKEARRRKVALLQPAIKESGPFGCCLLAIDVRFVKLRCVFMFLLTTKSFIQWSCSE
jgi:hypothetical protein